MILVEYCDLLEFCSDCSRCPCFDFCEEVLFSEDCGDDDGDGWTVFSP